MRLDWLSWSNPVAVWWCFLIVASAANVTLLLFLFAHYRRGSTVRRAAAITAEPLLLLCAAYVLGCSFRSVLPRADVQRICLFDTWLSSVFVGRSVATVAEICFVVQWAIVLRVLAETTRAETARNISRTIVPLIVAAEACSWYAVITTNYLGNVLENSLWTATFVLIAIALLDLMYRYHSVVQWTLGAAAVGIAGYVAFMCTIDVPMYFIRWQADLAHGREFLGLFSGLHDVSTRWIVTHDALRWKGEMAWMALYFSTAVWMSLLLAGFAFVRQLRAALPARAAGSQARSRIDRDHGALSVAASEKRRCAKRSRLAHRSDVHGKRRRIDRGEGRALPRPAGIGRQSVFGRHDVAGP